MQALTSLLMTEKHQHHEIFFLSPSSIKFRPWQVQDMELVMTIIRDTLKQVINLSSKLNSIPINRQTFEFFSFLICLKLTQQ